MANGKKKKKYQDGGALKRAPEAYKIHSQQLAKEAAASGQKGTLRKGKSQFRKDISAISDTGLSLSSIKLYQNMLNKIRKSDVVKKGVSKVKSYFGYKHGGKTNYRHGGGLEQYD